MDKRIIQRVVIGAVIVDEDKVLILQRNADETTYPNLWELPSGKREFLESSLDCLRREIKEECGLDAEPIMPFSVFDYQIEKPEEIRDSTQVNFLAKASNLSELSLSSEHQASAWVTESEISNYNLTESTKQTIREAFAVLKKL